MRGCCAAIARLSEYPAGDGSPDGTKEKGRVRALPQARCRKPLEPLSPDGSTTPEGLKGREA